MTDNAMSDATPNTMSEETLNENEISISKNAPKITKQHIRLPRSLIFEMHNARYIGTGTSYASCVALVMVLAKLTPLTGDAANKIIPLRRLRVEWRMCGSDTTALRQLLRNINASPLAAYIAVDLDNSTITATPQWLSAVVSTLDTHGLNYVRVPTAIIPMIKSHTLAIDVVLFAAAKNIRPHTYLLPQHRRKYMKKDKLQSMIDEVVQVWNTNNIKKDNMQTLLGQITQQLDQVKINVEKLRQTAPQY